MTDAWHGGWFFPFGGFLFFIFAIFLVSRVACFGRAPWQRGWDSPPEILKRRLASGQITEDEYARLREALDR